MKIGIVGSREYKNREVVYDLVKSFDQGDIIISGGCCGVDTWAEDMSKKIGLSRIIHEPNLAGVRNRGEAARRYFERNKLIAQDCDVLHAFVSPDRKGGTENTISHAVKLGKPVIIHE
ncbi:MAG: hypothetical protein JRC68_06300 [Deltaproteobacteria bacterium]|nr:hypothetical protein [Deltaproteobacteria bacterium]